MSSTTAPLDLIQPDGSVRIPPAVASDVLRHLVLGLTARVRTDGGEVSPAVRRLLYALHDASQRAEPAPGSEAGTPPPPQATVEIGTAEAAALLECSSGYVRRLARTGRIQARRLGAAWLIDPAALDAYRHGSAGDDHAPQPEQPP